VNKTKQHKAEWFFGQQEKQESNDYSVMNSSPSPLSSIHRCCGGFTPCFVTRNTACLQNGVY